MPIYEFYCPDNHRIYSFLARSVEDCGRLPRCPDDPEFRLVKAVSRFAVTGRAGDENEDGLPEGVDEAGMEAVMGELGRDLAGIDEDNPNPRQMGRVMRKMCEMTGQRVPGAMEEMIRRMEGGEDPEALEEEYGEVLDSEDFDMGGVKKLPPSRVRAPVRDPVLYELADYL